ncbi:MAG: response regulator transcription factor [Leptospiraceae bacterium]|nr:response regulator transcription factor [Leptospiraceae bacterium]
MNSLTSVYRIFIADDHDVLRFGLKALLTKDSDVTIIGEADNGQDLLDSLEKASCDLVILDLSMPGMDGFRTLDLLRQRFPYIKVLIYSMHKEKEFFRKALTKNVNGYILKDENLEKLLEAVREIRSGKKYFSSELILYLADQFTINRESEVILDLLTKREREILKMIASGSTNKEIGGKLDISPRTVQTHRTNLMEKLRLKNTADLVKFAYTHGLL